VYISGLEDARTLIKDYRISRPGLPVETLNALEWLDNTLSSMVEYEIEKMLQEVTDESVR
jgi:hypothetical protein